MRARSLSDGTHVTVFDGFGQRVLGDGENAFTDDDSRAWIAGEFPWASGTLHADCRRRGSVAASDDLKTAGQPAQVKRCVDRTTIQADGRDLAYVTADIQDAHGVFAATATNSVAFAVSDRGKIVGVDNGNAIDTMTYSSLTRNAFSGKVLAMVRSTGATGQIVVSATSSGLTAGSVSVTAQ